MWCFFGQSGKVISCIAPIKMILSCSWLLDNKKDENITEIDDIIIKTDDIIALLMTSLTWLQDDIQTHQ